MDNLTPGEVWALIAAAAAAIVLLGNAGEKIGKAIQYARKPNAQQDERLQALEEWQSKVDRILNQDKQHFDKIDEGNRATQRALLALLDHGIDGNNLQQMRDAKQELQDHLINR